MSWPFESEEQISAGEPVEVTATDAEEKGDVQIQAQAVQDAKAIEKNHQYDPVQVQGSARLVVCSPLHQLNRYGSWHDSWIWYSAPMVDILRLHPPGSRICHPMLHDSGYREHHAVPERHFALPRWFHDSWKADRCHDFQVRALYKGPPRTTFACQVAATVWAAFVQIATMNWALGSIDEVCTSTQKDHFTYPNGRTFFSSSIVWGLIGSRRMFGAGSIYHTFNYFWLLGALLPVALWVLLRVFPSKKLRWIHAPVMLGALGWLPPATPLSFSSWAIVGLIFNYGIRRRFHGWWTYYNYLSAAALDCGLLVSTIVIFLAIILPNVTIPQWWGNVEVFETMDSLGTAIRKTAADGETFGPTSW